MEYFERVIWRNKNWEIKISISPTWSDNRREFEYFLDIIKLKGRIPVAYFIDEGNLIDADNGFEEYDSEWANIKIPEYIIKKAFHFYNIRKLF